MIIIFASSTTMAPVIIRNMVQIFGVVTLPVLKVLIHPAGGPLGRAAIRLEGVGEISGVGSLNP